MTETYRILRLLGRRIAATTFYQVGEVVCGDGQMSCLPLHLADAHVLLCIDEDPADGRAKICLSFLARSGSLHTTHLNQWVRPPGRMSVPALVNDLWESFWVHEVENRQLGRIQWMHGPDLPFLEEDVQLPSEIDGSLDAVLTAHIPDVPGSVDPVEALLASIQPGHPQKPLLVDVLDLFD